MRLQIVSDIHLEFRKNRYPFIPARAPHIALLGDIGRPFSSVYARFIGDLSRRFHTVIFVAGNHEYYSSTNRPVTVAELKGRIHAVCGQYKNVHFLDNRAMFIDGVRILGSTLWTFIPPEMWSAGRKRMNDYRMTFVEKYADINVGVPLAPEHTTKWHEDAVEWLKEELRATSSPTVVLTHHAPSHIGTSDPKYKNDDDQCFYSTDLTALFKHPVVAWAYGHTHYPQKQITPSGMLLLSNPTGYPGELDTEQQSIDAPPVINVPSEMKTVRPPPGFEV